MSCDVGKAREDWRMSCDVDEVTERLDNELCSLSMRMSCDVGEVSERLENELCFQSLHLCHNSFSNPSVALPTSQFILQPFRCFIYVTADSLTLLSLLLRHRLFTCVTWRAAHGWKSCSPSITE